jgi:glycosyltransferase involved in cell wall biosynthesis
MADESHVGLPSFAVVVPMFNERSGAERCVREITRVLSGLPHRASLIVVDDGSKDGTTTILQALSQTNGVLELLSNPVNRGCLGRRRLDGAKPRSRRVSRAGHPGTSPYFPIPNAQNGWLKGVWLVRQHEGEGEMRPYRKFGAKTGNPSISCATSERG